jgi:hypothetical protein
MAPQAIFAGATLDDGRIDRRTSGALAQRVLEHGFGRFRRVLIGFVQFSVDKSPQIWDTYA